MTTSAQILPNLALPPIANPRVAVLAYDGLCTFEFGIATEIFGLPRPEMGPAWYRCATAAVDPGPMRAEGGLRIGCDGGLELLLDAGLIVVPGWRGLDAPVPAGLIAALRAAHARGARLASICSGAFVLAATGLLDGGTVSTHWRYAEALQRRFPAVTVDAASLYREHDGVFTSAGSAAGIDLLIEIVRRDFGAEAANSVARRLVVPAHRSGGQAQFLERPVPARPTGEVAPLLDTMREALDRDWTTEAMARDCRMSLRTFLRRFQEATGASPGDWLISERVEAAKSLLSSDDLAIEGVAAAVGFGSAHALRHHFRKKVGLTPTEYRSRFVRVEKREGLTYLQIPFK